MAARFDIATLNINIVGSSGPMEAAIGDILAEMERVPPALDKMSPVRTGAVKDTKKFQQAMNQASYGVEDFLTVVGTGGLGGGLRAAGNNISQVARTLLGPNSMYAGLIGIGAAIASIVVPRIWDWITAEDALQARLERRKKYLEDAKKSIPQIIDNRLRMEQEDSQHLKVNGLEGAKRLRDSRREELQDSKRRLEEIRAEAGYVIANISQLQSDIRDLNNELAKSPWQQTPIPGKTEAEAVEERRKEVARLREELEKARVKRGILGSEYDDQSLDARRKESLLNKADRKQEAEFEKQHAKDLKRTIDEVFSRDAIGIPKADFNNIAKGVLGDIKRQASIAIQSLQRFWDQQKERRQEMDKAQKMSWDLYVDGIEDQRARKLAAVEAELEADHKKIDSLKNLTKEEERSLRDRANLKAQVAAKELLSEQSDQLRKEASSRVRNTSVDPNRIDSESGSALFNSILLKHSSAQAEQDAVAVEISKLEKALKPILSSLNSKLGTAMQLVPMNLKN